MTIAVIGAGASGMMAALTAAETPENKILLFERQARVGRKLAVTGNGRCNLTNQEMSWEKFHGQNPAFVRDILSQFSLEDTLKFFDELGIVVTDKKGWLYPRGGQAKYIP